MIASPQLLRRLVLDGSNLFESVGGAPGKLLGPFQLQEGSRSERMTIIERCFGELRASDVTALDESNARRFLAEKAPSLGPLKILLVLEGIFQRADAKNANGRIYPGPIWDTIFLPESTVLSRIERGEMLGETDHPRDGETLLMRVSCCVTNIRRDANDPSLILGRMVVFDTPGGRIVEGIVRGGGRVGVSSRGQGSVVRMGGADVVQSDFVLETWDIVHNPSTFGAYPEPRLPGAEAMGESRSGGQETGTMSAVTAAPTKSDLRERLDRLKKYDIAKMSEDAKGMFRENLTRFREDLRKAPIQEQIDLTTEATLLVEAIAEEPEVPGAKPADEEDTNPAIDATSKKFGGTVKEADEEDGDDAPPPFAERATESASAAALLRGMSAKILSESDPNNLASLVKSARKHYREATGATGTLSTAELDGLSTFIHEVKAKVSEAKKAPAKKKISEAEKTETYYTVDADTGKVRPDSPTKMTRKQATQFVMDRMRTGARNIGMVPERGLNASKTAVRPGWKPDATESTGKSPTEIASLYEAQVHRTQAALAEASKLRAEMTTLSTRQAATAQIAEGLTAKCRSYKKALGEKERSLDAAAKLIEALATEVSTSALNAAVKAISETHPHVRGLAEALTRTNSVQEAVAVANRRVLAGLPQMESREALPGKSNQRDAAIRASSLAEKKAQDALAEKQRAQSMKHPGRLSVGLVEQTGRVTNALRQSGAGR